MKVIIDIVPNHVARNYESISRPDGIEDFGASDDTTVEWARDNNFYYVVGEDFEVPEFPDDYSPLGGEAHPLADGQFEESPAKWTGNGARAPQPAFNDWYETVKMNYGVRPDGSYAFDRLPEEAREWPIEKHADFWAGKDVPDSWTKFRDIVLYWTAKGVDGFRYDMAEMVPVEFWSYLNASIKAANRDAFLLAEVYNPSLYRDYLQLGRMDYLYDKVGLYDTLKPIMRGEASAAEIAPVHGEVLDIAQHMLHFLENHDEQRIASPGFAGDAEKAKPAMVVSALLSQSPTMVYFGQAVGEPGDGDAGFGDPTRTTIFDYWGVPNHQRWMNGGAFDGGQLTDDERALRDFYVRLLNLSKDPVFAAGMYAPLESGNDKLFAFVRWHGNARRIIVSNFDDEESHEIALELPADLVSDWQLSDGRYILEEQLYGTNGSRLIVDGGKGNAMIRLGPLESVVLEPGRQEIVRHTSFGSNFVPPRHIDVWLPAGYGESDKTYKVLYAHDGQNLFNPEWSHYTRTDWGIDETLQRLIDSGEVDDTIVVGIWNTPDRIAEYYPQPFLNTVTEEARRDIDSMMMNGPAANAYLRFIVEDLKPFIDANYHTRTGRDDTVLMGSSLGGLVSWYGLVSYPDVFSAAACISSSWPWTVVMADPVSRDSFVRYLRDATPPPGESRFYFDYGTQEMPGRYEMYQGLVDDVFRARRYVPGELWQSQRFEGAEHNEQAWSARVHIPLKFLLGTDNKKE